MQIKRREFLAASLGTAVVASLPQQALAAYPEKIITAIVPFAAGSAVEVVARLMAPGLSKALGQSILVTPKPGADGMLGTSILASSPQDGYTILFTAGSATIGPAMHRSLTFDPINQIAPIAAIGTSSYVIAVNTKLNVNTVDQLIALARSSSRKLNAAAAGNATQLSAALFAIEANAKVEIVTYDGNSQASLSVATGETDFAVMDRIIFESLAASGRVKLLAVAAPERLPDRPDLPTVAEVGLPNYSVGSTFGVYTVQGTPKGVIDRLNTEINKILADPEIIKVLQSMGLEPSSHGMTADQFGKFYRDEIARWKDTVQKANIPTVD